MNRFGQLLSLGTMSLLVSGSSSVDLTQFGSVAEQFPNKSKEIISRYGLTPAEFQALPKYSVENPSLAHAFLQSGQRPSVVNSFPEELFPGEFLNPDTLVYLIGRRDVDPGAIRAAIESNKRHADSGMDLINRIDIRQIGSSKKLMADLITAYDFGPRAVWEEKKKLYGIRTWLYDQEAGDVFKCCSLERHNR